MISMLDTISYGFDGSIDETEIQYLNLLEAQKKPHVMDDATMESCERVYTEQMHFMGGTSFYQ